MTGFTVGVVVTLTYWVEVEVEAVDDDAAWEMVDDMTESGEGKFNTVDYPRLFGERPGVDFDVEEVYSQED